MSFVVPYFFSQHLTVPLLFYSLQHAKVEAWDYGEAWDYDPESLRQEGHMFIIVQVHVRPVNDPPSIQGPDGNIFTGREDFKIPLSAGGGITISDPDEINVDEDDFMEIRVSVMKGILRLPWSQAGGLYLLNGEINESPNISARGGLYDINRALQGLSYRPPPNWNGEDQLHVWVSDLGDSIGANSLETSTSFVVLVEAVEDAPEIRFPKTLYHLEEDTSLALDFFSILDADTNSILTVNFEPNHGVVEVIRADREETETLYHESDDGGIWLTLRGMTRDMDAAVQRLKYNPPKDFVGQVILSVHAMDQSGLKAEEDVYMFVRAINDPPEIYLRGHNGTPTIQMSAGGSGDALVGILITDVDVDDSPDVCSNIQELEGRNALSLNLSSNSGTVSVAADRAIGVWIVSAAIAGPQETLVLRGSLESLQTALDGGSIMYSAPASFSGRDFISIEVDDGGNCGYGGVGSMNFTLQIDVTPYDPPILVEFDTSTPADTAFFIREGESLVLPDLVVTGGSIREQAAVEVVVLAVSGNVTLQPGALNEVEVFDGTGTTGSRIHIRGSPAALRTALAGISFDPRPHFYGCWDRDFSFPDDTPVRFSTVQGPQALARVFAVGTPRGEGVDVKLGGPSIKQRAAWSSKSVRISVGWKNDPPTINAPKFVLAAQGSFESIIPGIRVNDPDVNDALEGRGRLDVHLWTLTGVGLAVNDMVALRNGLRNTGIDEQQVRLKGRPEYINNVLATLEYYGRNETNGTMYTDGAFVDEIFVCVSDLGFTGSGGELSVNTSIVVKAGSPASTSGHKRDIFVMEKILPLVKTNEDVAVALPGFATAFSGVNDAEETTVIISAREGRLSLGPHGEGVAVATDEEWGPAVTRIEITGGAEKPFPEVQVRGDA